MDKNLVEGEWKNYIFKIANPTEDRAGILEHLRHTYYLEEPCQKYLGRCDTKEAELDAIVSAMLYHNLTLVAIDKASQKIVGVRVVNDGRQKLSLPSLAPKSTHLHKIFKLKREAFARAEGPFWEEVKSFGDNFAAPYIASVEPGYRGNGLATEMTARSLNLLRAHEFPIIRSFFSSPITRKIAMKAGYQEIARVYYDELIGFDGEGTLDFQNAEPGSFATFMALKLT